MRDPLVVEGIVSMVGTVSSGHFVQGPAKHAPDAQATVHFKKDDGKSSVVFSGVSPDGDFQPQFCRRYRTWW